MSPVVQYVSCLRFMSGTMTIKSSQACTESQAAMFEAATMFILLFARGGVVASAAARRAVSGRRTAR